MGCELDSRGRAGRISEKRRPGRLNAVVAADEIGRGLIDCLIVFFANMVSSADDFAGYSRVVKRVRNFSQSFERNLNVQPT